jgi:ABC-type transport system involved in multi-copper enzyme maturation permease subunit
MASFLSLIRWEWFKMRRRWAPWILLAVIVAFPQVVYWSVFTFGEITGETSEVRLLPNSIEFALTVGFTMVLVSMVIWTASALGSEYGWGTFRTSLAKGTGRWQLLSAVFVLMFATGVAWLVVLCLTMGISSLIVGLIAEGGGVATAGEWSGVLVQLAKSAVALAPYIALAMLFTVLTSSGGVTIGITLVYKFLVEDVLVPILTLAVDWFGPVSDFVLGRAVSGWLASPNPDDGVGAAMFLGADGLLPGTLHSLAVMLAYTVGLGAVTLWLFQRKDIGGAKGP